MNIIHIEGKKKGKVMLYALSTCIWCKKTKQLLDDLGVEYDYVYVDLESGAEKTALTKEIIKHSSDIAFPTMVIDDLVCIQGYDVDKIKEKLG